MLFAQYVQQTVLCLLGSSACAAPSRGQTVLHAGPLTNRALALPAGLNLLQTSIEELASFMRNGSLTSVALVRAYLCESTPEYLPHS
jgi:hypothetical protein